MGFVTRTDLKLEVEILGTERVEKDPTHRPTPL